MFQRDWLPRSLRWQFVLALSALEVLIVAGGLTAIYALGVSTAATQHLAQERLVHLQDAQDMVQRALLIERDTQRMLSADTLDDMRNSYGEIVKRMDGLDGAVAGLGAASDDPSVLALHQAAQLFRNTVHVVARLHEEELRAARGCTQRDIASRENVRRLNEDLRRDSVLMVAAAQDLSAWFTRDYRDAVDRLVEHSRQDQRNVLILLVCSVALAWIISRYFLGHRVLSRLRQVSRYLREEHAGGEAQHVPVEGRDEIGEMARAVEAFLEDRRRLAEANAELESFSYSVSHDLRSPLRAIDGYSQILTEDYGARLDEEGRRLLESIRRNTGRMGKLIDDLLAFSRTSRQEMKRVPIDLAALVREVFAEARAAAPERDITMRVGELPSASGDPAMIRQVLFNLVANAVKFTSKRDAAVIEVEGASEEGWNVYSVKDNGIGFDMQYADRLFGVFQRLHSAADFEGTGIGLAIVKRIILRHGGRIWAESRPGEGATFHFTLPRD